MKTFPSRFFFLRAAIVAGGLALGGAVRARQTADVVAHDDPRQ